MVPLKKKVSGKNTGSSSKSRPPNKSNHPKGLHASSPNPNDSPNPPASTDRSQLTPTGPWQVRSQALNLPSLSKIPLLDLNNDQNKSGRKSIRQPSKSAKAFAGYKSRTSDLEQWCQYKTSEALFVHDFNFQVPFTFIRKETSSPALLAAPEILPGSRTSSKSPPSPSSPLSTSGGGTPQRPFLEITDAEVSLLSPHSVLQVDFVKKFSLSAYQEWEEEIRSDIEKICGKSGIFSPPLSSLNSNNTAQKVPSSTLPLLSTTGHKKFPSSSQIFGEHTNLEQLKQAESLLQVSPSAASSSRLLVPESSGSGSGSGLHIPTHGGEEDIVILLSPTATPRTYETMSDSEINYGEDPKGTEKASTTTVTLEPPIGENSPGSKSPKSSSHSSNMPLSPRQKGLFSPREKDKDKDKDKDRDKDKDKDKDKDREGRKKMKPKVLNLGSSAMKFMRTPRTSTGPTPRKGQKKLDESTDGSSSSSQSWPDSNSDQFPSPVASSSQSLISLASSSAERAGSPVAGSSSGAGSSHNQRLKAVLEMATAEKLLHEPVSSRKKPVMIELRNDEKGRKESIAAVREYQKEKERREKEKSKSLNAEERPVGPLQPASESSAIPPVIASPTVPSSKPPVSLSSFSTENISYEAADLAMTDSVEENQSLTASRKRSATVGPVFSLPSTPPSPSAEEPSATENPSKPL